MVNALLPNTEYASVQEGNALKIPMVQEIIKKLIKTGKTPSELAGSDWKHWMLGINKPGENYREVLNSTNSDAALVQYASEEDPTRHHHLLAERHDMYGSDSDTDHSHPGEMDDSDTESEGLMEEKEAAYHAEGEWLGAQFDEDAIERVPEEEWVEDHRAAKVAYNAGGWSSMPYKPRKRDEEDEEGQGWVSGGDITEEEHMAFLHRLLPSKYTDFHRKYDW
jgi:hypothetical protein